MILLGRNTSCSEEPFVAVVRFTSLIRRCPKPRESPTVSAFLPEAFERLELCELETLPHSS